MKRFFLILALSLTLVSPVGAQDANSQAGAAALSTSPIQLLPDCLRVGAQDADISCVSDTILHFTNLLLFLVALGAFLYVLYGGFLYTTAFGDESKVKTAKDVIKNALLGVIIATLAYALIGLLKNILQVE